jgi:hypothetical protein
VALQVGHQAVATEAREPRLPPGDLVQGLVRRGAQEALVVTVEQQLEATAHGFPRGAVDQPSIRSAQIVEAVIVAGSKA